jgi:hypothetical protein
MKDKENFFLSLSITLGVIVLGLVSYIVYSEYKIQTDTPDRCPYKGWSYDHGEAFDAGDGCNICLCNDGIIVCTEKVCENINLEDN